MKIFKGLRGRVTHHHFLSHHSEGFSTLPSTVHRALFLNGPFESLQLSVIKASA